MPSDKSSHDGTHGNAHNNAYDPSAAERHSELALCGAVNGAKGSEE